MNGSKLPLRENTSTTSSSSRRRNLFADPGWRYTGLTVSGGTFKSLMGHFPDVAQVLCEFHQYIPLYVQLRGYPSGANAPR